MHGFTIKIQIGTPDLTSADAAAENAMEYLRDVIEGRRFVLVIENDDTGEENVFGMERTDSESTSVGEWTPHKML